MAGSTLVTALGGNGSAFGLQLAGEPGVWHTVPASPPEPWDPQGTPVGGAPPPLQPLQPPAFATPGQGDATASRAGQGMGAGSGTIGAGGVEGRGRVRCGAMGDSAVVDALGFGAQLRPCVLPEQRAQLGQGAASSAGSAGLAEAGVRAALGRRRGLGCGEHSGLAAVLAAATASGTGGVGAAGGAAVGPGLGPVLLGVDAAQALRCIEAAAEPSERREAAARPLAVNLSVLDGEGVCGILGRGVYVVPAPLLRAALRALTGA